VKPDANEFSGYFIILSKCVFVASFHDLRKTLAEAQPRRTSRTPELMGSTIRRKVFLGNRTLLKLESCLFPPAPGPVFVHKEGSCRSLPPRRPAAGHPFPLDRHLCPDGATDAADGWVSTEGTCPPTQPLVKSFRTGLPLHWSRILRQSRTKGQ